jgi:glycosyltransferase involved in cell wall biosynthesis
MTATNGRIRIVLVIDDLEYGGAQRQVVELANNMDRDRFEVHICTLSHYVPLGGQLKDGKERLHVIIKKNRVDFTVVLRLSRLLKSLNADIVQSYLFSADIASRLAGRWAGTKLIVGSERNADYSPGWKQLLAYRLTRRCVDLTIANSHAGASFNSRMFGQPASQYRVVYNGVDTTRFRPRDKNALQDRLRIARNDRIVGVFASFKPQKNHFMLLRAFRKVLDDRPDTRLLLVGGQLYGRMGGTEEYQAQMERLIDELGMRSRCTFLGNCNDVEQIYPVCAATVLSSFYEGTPNALLESMACGVPVVATNVSDNTYVVREGQTGFLVALDDVEGMAARLGTLLGNVALRDKMGREAVDWVTKEFSTERLVKNTEAVYLEALDGKRGR